MSTITPEQFMTQPEPDEEELAVDPLTSIAQSLRELVHVAEIDRNARAYGWEIGQGQPMSDVLEASPANPFLQQDLDDTRQDLADLEAKYDELYALLGEIEATIKPSTSKLANSVRDAITRWRAPEVPIENAVEMGAHVPAHDAPVEEWREYARCAGFDNAESDLDTLNRSQIRTLLGIEQPS